MEKYNSSNTNDHHSRQCTNLSKNEVSKFFLLRTVFIMDQILFCYFSPRQSSRTEFDPLVLLSLLLLFFSSLSAHVSSMRRMLFCTLLRRSLPSPSIKVSHLLVFIIAVQMVDVGYWQTSTDYFTPIDQVTTSAIDSQYAYFLTRSHIIKIALGGLATTFATSATQIPLGSGYQRYDFMCSDQF